MHFRRRRSVQVIAFVTLILGGFSFSSCQGIQDQKNHAASDLLSAFSSGCSSSGSWTQVALTQTQVLIDVLNNLKNDPACTGVVTALSNAQNLFTELKKIQGSSTAASTREAEETVNQLRIELARSMSEGDTGAAAILSDALVQAKVKLADARASDLAATGNLAQVNLSQSMTQLSSYLTALLSDQSSLTECSRTNPGLAVQLGAGILAISGTLVMPAAGPLMSMAGQLMGSVVEFARHNKLAKAILDLESIQMQTALSCGLEAMSNTYCEAEDALTLVELQADNYVDQWKPTEFWSGLDLWSQKVPDLLIWMSKLGSGVEPRDRAASGRQNDAWANVFYLQTASKNTEADIAFTQKRLSTSAPADREIITRGGLNQIFIDMWGNSFTSPPGSIISNYITNATSLLYRIVGRDPAQDACTPGSTSGTCKGIDTIPLPTDGFDGIATNARKVFAEVRKQVFDALHLVIDVDPSAILREAFVPDAMSKESPLEVLGDVTAFLDASAIRMQELSRTNASAADMLPLNQDTRRIIQNVIDSILSATGDPTNDELIITRLFDELKLLYDTSFVSNRLYLLIKADYYLRLKSDLVPKDVKEILIASGEDPVLRSIRSGSGTQSLERLRQDLVNAQGISQQNLEKFIDTFGDAFAVAIRQLRDSADRAGEPTTGKGQKNRIQQARVCALLASTGTHWPKSVDQKLCQGTEIESVYPALGQSLKFDELIAKKNDRLDTRMCAYRDFLRRDQLFRSKPWGLE